jgi:chemotaxis protein CheD
MTRAETPSRVFPGFEHIQRHWDATHQTFAAKLLPGEYYVTVRNEIILTVLGSCVSACIRDPVFGIGGMNHFMLPVGENHAADSWSGGSVSAVARYGNFAMEQLVNAILKHGGSRQNLEVKIFGGGRILAQMTDIGRRNIAFVREYIRTEGLRLVAEDVGDTCPRKIVYFPVSGRVRMKRLRALHNDDLVEQETRYLGRLSKPLEGSIELF